jgi:hypothetical protein
MKYLPLCLMFFLGLLSSAFAIEIGEGQVMRLSSSKKRAILKIDKLDFKNAKRLYLSSGLNDEPIALQVIKVKNNYAIVKTIRGVIDKYTLYEVFLERPNLDKFKRRKLQEVEEEDREIRYIENKNRHYFSGSLGLMSLSDIEEDNEKLGFDFSTHLGFGIKYKFRAENDLGFFIEYNKFSGRQNWNNLPTVDIESVFSAFKLGILTQFEIGLYMQGGVTFHKLTSNFTLGESERELISSGTGFFVGAGYEQNFKASNWFYQLDFCYYFITYSKTEAKVDGQTVEVAEDGEANDDDPKQTALSFLVNFGYSF